MTRQEAQTDPGIVIGVLFISYIDAYILIDTGSTYSYISVDFAQNMIKEVGYLEGSIMMSVSLGGPFVIGTLGIRDNIEKEMIS